ncbi:MAG: hypothetical protein IRZ07_09560 [Microbispora sp.]|nr:hypothetical protein [Microbispora sp.]
MNDSVVRLLGVLNGPATLEPPGGLAPGLQERIERGIVRRGQVLARADSVGKAEGAPSFFRDLTAWECADSSFHLEDFVPVEVATVDDAPFIAEDDQRILLLHGLAFARRFCRLVYALDPPSPVRCIIGANETNATFRFHLLVRPRGRARRVRRAGVSASGSGGRAVHSANALSHAPVEHHVPGGERGPGASRQSPARKRAQTALPPSSSGSQPHAWL